MEKFIIIGAGMSGLYAATLLSRKYDVIIVEAQSQPGGRIRTVTPEGFSGPVDAGAEFVHGKGALTQKLIRDSGAKTISADGNILQFQNGQWVKHEELMEGWDELLQKMETLKADMTLSTFLEEFYGDEKYASFRAEVSAFATGFDIADPDRVSVKSLSKEWNAQEENKHIIGGYDVIIRHLCSQLEKENVRVVYNAIAKKVNWARHKVTVFLADGQSLEADRLLVTAPAAVLQQSGTDASIDFVPSIAGHIDALGMIGPGAVIKVLVECNRIFWNADTRFFLSKETIPTWWTRDDKPTLLTGWLGGPGAWAMAGSTDEEIKEAAYKTLVNIFGLSREELTTAVKSIYVCNWAANKFSQMAYSYSMPESVDARKVLKTPVEDTIYFAGEACYDGDAPGTVEAALMSSEAIYHLVHRST